MQRNGALFAIGLIASSKQEQVESGFVSFLMISTPLRSTSTSE